MDEARQLEIDTVLDGHEATVTVRGELDLATKDQLLGVLHSLLDSGVTAVVVDIAGVPFMDSSGLSALLEVHRGGAALTLRHPMENVRRLLEVIMIGGLVTIEA